MNLLLFSTLSKACVNCPERGYESAILILAADGVEAVPPGSGMERFLGVLEGRVSPRPDADTKMRIAEESGCKLAETRYADSSLAGLFALRVSGAWRRKVDFVHEPVG
jgi:hypothetical protein